MSPLRCALVALVLMTIDPFTMAGDRIAGQPFATRSPVIARHGMVCASQPLAAQVGLDILKAGGSAVDAAIATNAMLGLTEPVGCGIGGDLFVILWDNEKRELVGLNGSGRSPRGMTLEMLQAALDEQGRTEIPLKSGLAVSVPGLTAIQRSASFWADWVRRGSTAIILAPFFLARRR